MICCFLLMPGEPRQSAILSLRVLLLQSSRVSAPVSLLPSVGRLSSPSGR